MSQKTLERLEILRKLKSKQEWINHGVYRLMFEEDLYVVAYERIKSKPGNMTPGTDGKTLDGFSLKEIQHMRKKMTDERFINLIWKLLKAGYLDIRGARKDSLAGTPQGGIASPILANVYVSP